MVLFFSWGPLRKWLILKSTTCTCYIHASIRARGKWFNISKLFSFGVQISGSRKIIRLIFTGGAFTRTYMRVNHQEKNTNDSNDCLGGYGSLHGFTRLGTRILAIGNGYIMIIMVNLHRSNIKNKFKKCANAHPNRKTRVFLWKYICPCKRVQTDMFSFTNENYKLETFGSAI